MKTKFTSPFPRAAIMLLLMMLTTTTAWAQEVTCPICEASACITGTVPVIYLKVRNVDSMSI